MRFAATVASVSARKKKHTTATHTHTAYIQTHLYLQSQNQMYLEGVLRWQKCGEGHLITIFINFQRMAMQFERILVYEENRQVHKLQTNLIESLKFYIRLTKENENFIKNSPQPTKSQLMCVYVCM